MRRGTSRKLTAAGIALAVGLGVALKEPVGFAQFLPFQSNKAVPIDAAQAFIEGYRAYKSGDDLAAIGRLELATTNFQAVGDYAFYFLAAAQAESGDIRSAADNYRRVTLNYPQSVLADSSLLEYARLQFKLGNFQTASTTAQGLADRTDNQLIEQQARLILAQAFNGLGQYQDAYAEAQDLRDKFPHSAGDATARQLARTILASHPSVADTTTLHYHLKEATLLIHEGELSDALQQLHSAMVIAPPPSTPAELYWLLAQANRNNDAEARSAWLHYLALEPKGPHAAAALDKLAHSYWKADDTEGARRYFSKIVTGFPGSEHAANAMFEIGRTYEDDRNLTAARSQYLRLIEAYPGSEEAQIGRFRAPFMLFMQHQYNAAASAFADARGRAPATDWAMFAYWQARSLDLAGNHAEADRVMREVARDTRSNYYPLLASQRLGIAAEQMASTTAEDPVAPGPVPEAVGENAFHLSRIATFRQIGLRELEPGELSVVAKDKDPSIRNWVLAEMQEAGGWYDGVQLATSMIARGEISPSAAERYRYPRGYWDLVNGQAQQKQIDPWLVAALIRQESLYNPQARSVSDARGLMQLLPSTADHWAPNAGVDAQSLDLFDPDTNVRIGTTYLKGLLGMFDGNEFRAVAAYNGGEHAVLGWVSKYPGDDDQWVENIGYKETREYVKKVLGGRREYRLLYAPRSGDAPSQASAASPG
ncbi:MAG TPA: transglycosylase SLT domain-containing protein [Candidatus Binataceae bacterium]|nr:transglycosylase SLT domain-containing protein [Candidatus Binataceae bacterium]